MKKKDCDPHFNWIGVATGLLLATLGTALTLSWVGAIVGLPLTLVAFTELVAKPTTTPGAPCAP